MKTALLLLCAIPCLLTGCEETLPLKLGVCKDDVCLTVETQIPARRSSGMEVIPVNEGNSPTP